MSLFVADFFSGLDGWGAAFRDRGHRVVSFDLDPRFKPNVVVDMNNVKAVNGFDVILASPPCECFSVMTIGRNWDNSGPRPVPKTDRAADALDIATHAFYLVLTAEPKYYVIENPRGMLRKVAPVRPTTTTMYCQWGMTYMKSTDIWTNIRGRGMVGDWPQCHNGNPDHERAPRGANAGTQRRGFGSEFVRSETAAEIRARLGLPKSRGGSNHDMDRSAARALIPYRLSLAVCLAAERDGTLPSMEEVIEVEAELRRVA